jgi:uncharacterized delta-60 repeat protein
LVTSVLLCLALVTPLAALAATGDLDPTFGTGGLVTTALGIDNTWANATAIQTDGKIVAAGQCQSIGAGNFCLARYDSSGSFDGTFGVGGVVTTLIGSINTGGYSEIKAIAIQGDGLIVAAGLCFLPSNRYSFCLARYHDDGSLDTSFGSGGMATAAIGSLDAFANAVAIDGDAGIVAAGYCVVAGMVGGRPGYVYHFCVARYDIDGSLDASFGTGGAVDTAISGGCGNYCGDSADGVAIQSGGKIVASGTCSNQFCAARYNDDGTLDGSFGTAGTVLTNAGLFNDYASSVALQGDGKLIVAGSCLVTGYASRLFCLARYSSDGSLDTTFGAGASGYVTTVIAGLGDRASAVALQGDGKIVAAGTCVVNTAPSAQDWCLARYLQDGSLDTSFGPNASGKLTTALGFVGYDQANAVAVQADGKVVVAGWCGVIPGVETHFCLARYDGGAPAITHLTVTAPSTSKLLNGANPAFTPTYSGFIDGDDASSLTAQPTCTTTALTGSPVGSYPITCSGGVSAKYDFTDVAGTLSIIYGFDGFLQPINDTAHTLVCGSPCPASIFKGSSTVPVKFQLRDANGVVVQAASPPVWITPQKGGPTSAAVDETVYADPATVGTAYKWTGSHYLYDWSTKGFATGYYWRIGVRLDDGRTYYVSIGLR